MTKRSTATMTVGLDLGDRFSSACALDTESGELRREWRLQTTRKGLAQHFEGQPPMRIALEVGTHSPWVSRLLASWGHQVLVANPRKVRLIAHSRRKSDRFDGRTLARLARLDPQLLSPVRHRSGECQQDLALLRARAALVRARTLLVNHARGAVKSAGQRLPSCSAVSFARQTGDAVPQQLRATLDPVLTVIATLTEQIHGYEDQLEALSDRGECDPQMHITKEGDPFLRQLLVQSAHYILGPFGPDCDLRRHGFKLAQRGGKAAKKRAAIAVARKLAVVLHRLWLTQERYQPLRELARTAA